MPYGSHTASITVTSNATNRPTVVIPVTLEVVDAHAPVAAAVTASGDEDRTMAITLRGSDADGDPLTYAIISQPQHGTLSGSGAARSYVPQANWNGTDTCTYRVSDGYRLSAIATVTITVKPVNDKPVLSAIETTPLVHVVGQGATRVTATVVAGDVDSSTMASATVRITGNYQNGQDLLDFTNANGITKSWDAATGRLLLSGSSSRANYQAALRAVTYRNTSTTPVTTNRTITLILTDTGGLASSAVTRTVKVVRAGLISRWACDAGSGTTLADSVGTNTGTISGATWSTGRVGGALSFNGTTNQVNVANPSLALTNQVSIALWAFGGTSLPKTTCALYAKDAAGNRVLNLHLPWNSGVIYWDAGNGGTASCDRLSKATTSTSQYKGKWNHWVFTKNATAGTMAIYLNGTLWTSANGKTLTLSPITSLTLGAGNSYNYEGRLDDLRIYNKALDAAGVQALYASYPRIVTQPAAQTVVAGAKATFRVVASGTPAPTYQWRKNGVAITGATGATYTTPATARADNGKVFTCVVTNATGSVVSAGATLTVLVVPAGMAALEEPHPLTAATVVVQRMPDGRG